MERTQRQLNRGFVGKGHRQATRGRRGTFANKKQERKNIARQHISSMLNSAIGSTNQDQASRMAKLAWDLSTRFNVRLGTARRFFCHSCKKFMPPSSVRYRLSKKRKGLNVTCLKCGSTYRLLI